MLNHSKEPTKQMPDPFEDTSMNPPRYVFVKGRGDQTHAYDLNDKAANGYRAILMVFDPIGQSNNVQVVVLMERER